MGARYSASRAFVTSIAVAGFVLLYEATTFDSKFAARHAEQDDGEGAVSPVPGARLTFTATAYCKGTTTASGVQARSGVAAADPIILPVGSVIRLDSRQALHSGIYTIMDTGPSVRGRLIDVYIWSCIEALAFGRQRVDVTVLRLGWSPNPNTPRLLDRLLGRAAQPAPKPPASPPPLPAMPLPIGELTVPKE
ncbi:MAG: 3D domain-containing protein [Acidobacteria bacterium]|nr:3D domain-containing protein [Acidobacteriota bacterium]